MRQLTGKPPANDPPTKFINSQLSLAEENLKDLSYHQLYVLAETYQYGRYGKTVNLGKAVKLYEVARRKGATNVKHVGRCHMALARLYKDGGPNTEYIPEARKAIQQFLKALSCGCEEAIIEIANIYLHGLHPNYLPDKLTAGKIYGAFSRDLRCSQGLKSACHEKTQEISALGYIDLDNVPEPGREYFALPQTIIEDLNASLDAALLMKAEIVPYKYQYQRPHRHPQQAPSYDNDDIQQALWNDAQIRRVTAVKVADVLDVLPEQNIRSDSQNVHSSTVQNAALVKMKAIEQSTPVKSDFEANKKAFLAALSDKHQSSKKDIERVLDSLNEGKHSRYGKSETDVFNIVWSRVNDPVNNERKSDIIDVLAQNIASGVEHDTVVCSTGKIIRMVGSLDAMDTEPLPDLKPEWAINEEIATAAANVRKEVLETSTSDERAAYEAASPTDIQKEIADKVTQKMRDNLKRKCEGDYCDAGIMTKETLETKLVDYLENM